MTTPPTARRRQAGANRTYGDHQEAAASAFNQLLTQDRVPDEPGAVTQLLACQAAVLDALQERQVHLGVARARDLPTPLRTAVLTDLSKNPAALLAQVAAALPRMPREDTGLSPLDALGTASTDQTVEHWRRAAVELLTGTHALENAAERPWLQSAGAAWYLLGDASASLEAVCVLDASLSEVGLLNDHQVDPKAPSWTLEDQRLITSQCSRAASWYATTDEADLAVSALPSGEPVVKGPVRTVSEPADLIPGQRQLANHLKVISSQDPISSAYQVMDAFTMRMVTSSQMKLCEQLATYCASRPELAAIGEEFRLRSDMLADFQEHLRPVVDAEARGTNRAALWQHQEINQAMRRVDGKPQLSPRQLNGLAEATHDVVHNLAEATRYELVRDAGNLRRRDQLHPDLLGRMSRRNPLYRCAEAISKAPSPAAPLSRWIQPVDRFRLRIALDATPPTGRPPTPSPARGPDRPRKGIRM